MPTSTRIWPASAAAELIYPEYQADWQDQAPGTKPRLQARLVGEYITIEGAIAKPTKVSDTGPLNNLVQLPSAGGALIAIFDPKACGELVHSTGMFEATQAGRTYYWRFQLYPDGRLVAAGRVNKNKPVDQVYIASTFYRKNG